MNTMEEELWNYIDGTCSEGEQKAISVLIAQDEAYRRKYEELLSLDQQFSKMEMDEPSMAFTYNVMETIRADYAQTPLKASINPKIIKGIGGFFILTILILVIYVLSTTPVGHVNFSGQVPATLKVPDMTKYLSGPLLKGFFFFDLVLGLFLFDTYLRKRKVSKQV